MQKEVFLAAYEEPSLGDWKTQRDNLYESIRKLASERETELASERKTQCFTGIYVTQSEFQTACESGTVHFFGHHNSADENILRHGLVLVRDSNSKCNPVPEPNGNVRFSPYNVAMLTSCNFQISNHRGPYSLCPTFFPQT